MVRINLLPWRYKLQEKQRNRFFFGIFVSLLLGVLSSSLWVYYISTKIEIQNKRLSLLKNEIALLDAKIRSIESINKKIEDIVQRKSILEKIRIKQFEKVRLLNSLKQTIPTGVYFISLEENGNKLFIRGIANSETAVSILLRNFEKSPYYDETKLRIVEKKNREKIFELNTSFSYGKRPLE